MRAEPDLLDLMPDGLVVADAEGRVVRVNRVAAAWAGRGVDALVGRPLAEALPLLDTSGCDWVAYNKPYEGLPSRIGVPEQAWLLPDGEEVLTTAALRREGGRVVGVAVSLRSGRGRERLDRERSDLVATVAHELRSPLTGVKGFVQAMLNRWEVLSDDQKRLMLTTVNADADRLVRLIAELLDVARIDTGRLSLYPRPCDALALAERVVASISAGTSREVRIEADPDLPQIQADPDKFVQVLTNLVENGLRHGDGVVRVGLRAVAGGPGRVLTVVSDEGAGIAPEIRRRVFSKFWQHGTAGGSGLGMYIVGGLVEAHGGSVAIGETEAGGARIEVSWPAAAPDDEGPGRSQAH